MTPRTTTVLFLVALLLAISPAQAAQEFVGRYALSDGSVVFFTYDSGVLTFRPIFWTSVQHLRAVEKDSFVVVDRAERRVVFERDAAGHIAAVRITGIGTDDRAPRIEGPLTPVEMLFAGRPEDAARAVSDESTAVRFADYLTQRLPSRNPDAVRFLAAIEKRWPEDVKLHRVFGDALVAAGRRDEARREYALATGDADAGRALRMLQSAEDGSLPFTLSELFREPSAEERAAVLSDWEHRDLRPHDVQTVLAKGSLRIVSHRVYGSKHYTAVIVPENAKPGCCPVIIDAKGVSWDYFPRDLDKPLDSVELMGEDRNRFIFVIPSFRGEVMTLGDQRFVSEGDRTDVWDGATDDTIAALNVVLKTIPQADPNRICTFGRSRGGTVALLAAIRDPRIRCVVAWAAPTDHFQLMGQGGWTRQEAVAQGLREHSAPNGIGGQFIETFLRSALAGERPLAETRHHLIASSPLYFAGRLPRIQIHYGVDDPIVPLVNGKALASAAKNVETFFYPGFGHDTDRDAASRESRRFLLEILGPTAP